MAVRKVQPSVLLDLCKRTTARRASEGHKEQLPTRRKSKSLSRFSTQVIDDTPLSELVAEHEHALQMLRQAFLDAGGELDAHTDPWLLRFLVAVNGHISQGVEWIKRTTAWRIKSGMVERRRQVLAGKTMLEDRDVIRLLQFTPLLISHRTGAHDGPLSILHVGGFDPPRWMAGQGASEFISAGYTILEACATACDVASTAANKLIRREVLLDYHGLALRHLNPLVFVRLRPLLSLPDSHYPEIVGHVACINAPYLFSHVFNIISPWISDDLKVIAAMCEHPLVG